MIKKNKKQNKGFALLFAVTLSSILLSIALGATSIAVKQLKFGTSARATNDAFFAADTGMECALINDKSTSNIFNSTSGATTINCKGGSISLLTSYPSWNFVVSGLGSTGQGCAKVNITKDAVADTTIVTSQGYNIGDASCNSTSTYRIEREIQTNY